MKWIFFGIMLGAIAYLILIILGFIEKHRENREKIEQTEIDIRRLKAQLTESEHARKEAETRTANLEAEALEHEQEVSDLHQKINNALPTADEAPAQSA